MKDYRAPKYAATVGVFLTAKGAVGFRCTCGFLVFARSAASLEMALGDHQVADICAATRESEATDVEGSEA